MAVYTFRCRKCRAEIAVEHPISEPHPVQHAGCGGELGRVFDSQAGVVYRTSGFTKVDQRLEANPRDL